MSIDSVQERGCQICGASNYSRGEMRATGSLLTKIFNVQNRKFDTVTCNQCGHTLFFARQGKRGENVLDFFFN